MNLKKISALVLGVFAGALLAIGGLAVAQVSNTGLVGYVGYNPSTNLNGLNGVPFSMGTLPTLGASTACGTTATVTASLKGGSSILQATANATSCTLVINFQAAAPNGYFCVASDETTPADTMKQSAHTTTSCTVTGTVVSADNILVEVNAF